MTLQSDFTQREFRNVVGLFATGITVVTTRVGDEVYGMTVNSFTSVSLEPPLVLVCINQTGQLIEHLEHSRQFFISFLSVDQERHSRRYARQEGGEEIEEPILWSEGPPFIRGALGGLSCTVHQQIEAGDHIIVIGRVDEVWESETTRGALLYFRGRYQQGQF